MTLKRPHGIWLGMRVDPIKAGKVIEVDADSPAAKAGIEVNDVVRQFGTMKIKDSMHYFIALVGRKAGEEIKVQVQRGGERKTFDVKLDTVPMRAAATDLPELAAGLNWAAYQGNWTAIPDFDKLEPVERGRAGTFPPADCKAAANPFALKFTGYVEVPADGVYTFYVNSDDGSRLWIGDELVVDNDGMHAMLEKSGFIALKAGKHPITIKYFDAGGGKGLTVSYDGPNIGKRAVPPEALFGMP